MNKIDAINNKAVERYNLWSAEDKLALIKEAMNDRRSGAISSDLTLWTIIASIIYPPEKLTEEMYEWAMKSIKEHKEKNV